MARALRQVVADGWYHVYHRGTQRGVIFGDDRDRGHFLELLAEVVVRYRLRIHAYALMGTHYHAIVQTPDANLSQAMQWLHLSHAAWFNARYDRLGPFWQGRFGSTPVENGAWAYQLSLYLHLNVVSTREFGLGKRRKKAEGLGLRRPSREEVSRRLKTLREYRWSSYRAYGGYEKAPEWLETGELLRRASKKAAERHERYRADVQERLRHGVEEARLEQLRDRVAIGSEQFRRRLKRLASGGTRETSDRREWRRRVGIEEIIATVEQMHEATWDDLGTRRGDWGKPLVMWLARRYAGMTLQEVGNTVGGMDYAAVSVAVKRFEEKLRKNRALRRNALAAARLLKVET